MSKTEKDTVSFRLPKNLLSWLREKAEKEHRTLTGQMIHTLYNAKRNEEHNRKAAIKRKTN